MINLYFFLPLQEQSTREKIRFLFFGRFIRLECPEHDLTLLENVCYVIFRRFISRTSARNLIIITYHQMLIEFLWEKVLFQESIFFMISFSVFQDIHYN